jgi:hypothetical protein
MARPGVDIRDILKHWLPLALAITLMCGLVYLAVQQEIRLSANDPQIGMAEDLATALSHGSSPQGLLSARKVDIATSASAFVVAYDSAQKPVASTGLLDGQAPLLPEGVFGYTARTGEDRFTWQPRRGVRQAAVLVAYQGTQPGFVLAARSLREPEKRIDLLTLQVGAAWLVTLVVTLAAVIVLLAAWSRRES